VAVADVNDSSLFPVVLFVHADSYDVGTGNAYDGSVLAILLLSLSTSVWEF